MLDLSYLIREKLFQNFFCYKYKMLNYIKSFWNHSDDNAEEFQSKPRFTYRSDFAPILDTTITSDVGWGCCYRCTQGIIAQYLKLFQAINPEIFTKKFGQVEDILSLFFDTKEAIFSIHNLVKAAKEIGVTPGDWAKPSQVAQAFTKIFDQYHVSYYYVLDSIFEPSKIDHAEYPIIIMIPLKCGLTSFDRSHFPFMKNIFHLQNTLGIISGYSGSAYYVVKINDTEEVFYFDPHVVQPAATSNESFETFYNQKVMKMSLTQLNPSILMCFACFDKDSAYKLMENIVTFPDTPIMCSENVSDIVNERVLDIDDLDLS